MSNETIFTFQDSQTLLQNYFAAHDYFAPEEKSQITKAWELLVENTKEITRSNGEPYYVHPLRVAEILLQKSFRRINSTALQLFRHFFIQLISMELQPNRCAAFLETWLQT